MRLTPRASSRPPEPHGPRGKGPSCAPSTAMLPTRRALVGFALTNMHLHEPLLVQAQNRAGSPDGSNRLFFVSSRSQAVPGYSTKYCTMDRPRLGQDGLNFVFESAACGRVVSTRHTRDLWGWCRRTSGCVQDGVHRFGLTTRLVASSWPLERTGPRTGWLSGGLERGTTAVVWGRRSWAEWSRLRPPGPRSNKTVPRPLWISVYIRRPSSRTHPRPSLLPPSVRNSCHYGSALCISQRHPQVAEKRGRALDSAVPSLSPTSRRAPPLTILVIETATTAALPR